MRSEPAYQKYTSVYRKLHDELLASNAIYREVYESQTGGGGDFDENNPEGGDL